MRKRVITYILSFTAFLFLFHFDVYAVNESLSLEDISTSIVLTEQNLYVVNSKNELLVCGVADKYADNTNLDNRVLESLQTSLKKVMLSICSCKISV